MSKLNSCLLLVGFTFMVLAFMAGCDQTEDIAAPKSLTKVWLTAERLPAPIEGMTYGLWASKAHPTAISDPAEVALAGTFSFYQSDSLVTFVDANGAIRSDSNLFMFQGDLFDYEYLLITAEPISPTYSLPGPAMLVDQIQGNSDTLRLFFPKNDSLFDATVRCNFETPSDGNRFAADGRGLWFSIYEEVRVTIVDTNDVDISYVWDTIYPLTGDDGDTLNFASLYGPYPDSVWVEFDTVMYDFGKDSLPLSLGLNFFHNGAKQFIQYEVDSTIPRIVKNYDNGIVYDTVVRQIDLDAFSQDLFGLPDLSEYGWQYKGWVVSDDINPAAIGHFSPPGWDFVTGELLIPGYQGGLLTTGTFTDIASADDSDPFTYSIPWEVDSGSFIDTVYKRPDVPGEDFLDGAAISAATNGVYNAPIDLFSGGFMADRATVFVTIEPLNMVTDSTNFPLIAFAFQFPSSVYNGFYLNTGFWPLLNWTGSATGAKGFPRVMAKIQRL